MLNSDTKRHIDKARDVLVGVAPSPMTQVDLITTALIYKFMDDMDQQSIKAGGKPSFFIGDIEKYSWNKLIDPKLDNQGKVNLYQEALTKLPEASNLPSLFREIFKDTFLPFRNVNTFKLFIDEIDYFDYSHPEELGNAFEYLLTILGVSGDAGMFRTPRHIIDFIVKVVDPNKDDRILDPACGTAGFLIQAYKHIISKHDGLNDPEGKEETLTTEEIKNLTNNIEGYDISPEMVKLSSVNLYLHDFKNPKISEYDTLSSDDKWNERFDVILANPPFMTPRGGIIPHNRFSIQATKSEVLFVDYILTHLKHNGRAGIVVPEGIIFQSGNAYKELRKKLFNEGLFAVVSLPSGVFNPYSGVKTSILLIDKEIAKKQNELLFIKISNDGFDLGAQRREINKNDLPIALEILNKWKAKEKVENNIATYIEKTKISENADYNLSGDRYRAAADYTNAKWPMVKLGKVVVEMKDGGTPSRSKPEYFGGNVYWAVVKDIAPEIYDTKEKLTEEGLKNSSAKVWPVDSVIISLGATIGNVGIAKVPVATKQGISGIAVDKDIILPKYLYYILVNQKEFIQSQATGASIKEVRPSKLQEILTIPLPPLEVQEQIVEELDRYQKIIEGAKLITENWKPRIEIDSKWEKVKLGAIGKVCMCKRVFKEQTKNSGDVPFYKIGTFGKSPDAYIDQNLFEEYKSKYSYPTKGAVLLSTSGTIGRTVVFDGEPAYFQDSNIVWIDNDKKKAINEYLYYAFQTINWTTTKGGTIERLYNKQIEETRISLPSLELQKQIVEKIENEKKLVDSSKELIEIYEKRIKEKIDSLWKRD